MFIDEAHLIFNEASEVLLEQIETVIKLIRSKGIGIFFCTQNPMDVPASVLVATGYESAACTTGVYCSRPKTIKQAAENYPETTFL